MFRKTTGFTEVIGYLNNDSFKQFDQAINSGALLGALEVNATFYKVDSPPAPSPVGAQYINMIFYTWKNIKGHLNDMKSFYIQRMGRKKFRKWSGRVRKLSSRHFRLLAYSIPLFAENQMNSMSNYPSPAQDVFLNLLSPIIESDAKISDSISHDKQLNKSPNAKILVFLFAGQYPFTITLHEKSTIDNWKNYLEPATVILLPQVIFEAEKESPKTEVQIMRSALIEQVKSWNRSRPSVGDIRNWGWLPKLI